MAHKVKHKMGADRPAHGGGAEHSYETNGRELGRNKQVLNASNAGPIS